MKDVWVISLGGSRIVPDDVDDKFILDFKKLIDSHRDKRFVVVCGGGSSARRYISALRRLGKGNRAQSMEGIAITRLHAGFMLRFFGSEANEEIPMNMEKVKSLLRGNRVVFCGARATGCGVGSGSIDLHHRGLATLVAAWCCR